MSPSVYLHCLSCLIEGGKTPFVLRKNSGGGCNEYEIIGDCYVQDMMDHGTVQLTNEWRDILLV